MSSDTLRVAIIGAGLFAVHAHIPALRATGRAEVVAISRPDPGKLEATRKALGIPGAYTDWRQMLDRERLDAVVVATPDDLHMEPTLVCLERGLHVLVEKPMALSYRDALAMADAAARARGVLMVGYSMRFGGGLFEGEREKWESAVRELGLPPDIWADWGRTWYQDPGRSGGGMFANNVTHFVDRALWLAGAPPVDVVAFMENAGLPVDCFVNVQARLSNGVLFSLASADAVPQDVMSGTSSFSVVGDDGILYSQQDGSLWIHRDRKREKLEPAQKGTSAAAGFVATVLDGAENPAPAEKCSWAVALTEAAYRSAAEKRIVTVEARTRPPAA